MTASREEMMRLGRIAEKQIKHKRHQKQLILAVPVTAILAVFVAFFVSQASQPQPQRLMVVGFTIKGQSTGLPTTGFKIKGQSVSLPSAGFHVVSTSLKPGQRDKNGQIVPVCNCPQPAKPKRVWNNNLSVNSKGHLVERVWRWIPGRETHGGRWYPGRWVCYKSGTAKWYPGHFSKPTYQPGHWGWVYVYVRQ